MEHSYSIRYRGLSHYLRVFAGSSIIVLIGLVIDANWLDIAGAELPAAAIRIEAISDNGALVVAGKEKFLIPLSYIASFPQVGPAWGDLYCTTFPDFQPVPGIKPPCGNKLSSNGSVRFVAQFSFNLSDSGNNTSLTGFNNLRDAFHSQVPEILAGGVNRFTIGPADHRIDVYAWSTKDGEGAATCISFEPSTPREGACSNIFDLSNGLRLDVQFPESGILLAPQLQSGLRYLLQGFRVPTQPVH